MALPDIAKVAWINRSKPLNIDLTPQQLTRLRLLYPIDFAIHDALLSDSLSVGMAKHQALA